MNASNHNQTIVTCSGTFTDDGGTGGNYSNNITDRIITFCTANPGELLRFDFSSFYTETNFDVLEVFNGPTATGQPAQTYTGNLGAFVFISNQPGGCVTFRFNSDFSQTYSGWAAQISCVEPCIAPTAVLTDISTEIICSSSALTPGDLTLSFNASGSFSNDSFNVTTYEWNWGDGTTSTTSTPITTHTFPDDPGIYTVTLKVRTNNTGTDPLGCLSSNTAVKLVMVLPPPNFEGSTESPIEITCGDSVELIGIAGSQIITQEPPPNVGTDIELPDGNGQDYYSYIDLTGFFPAGETLTASCFPQIMLDWEHSYAGDLEVDLIAPTGQTVRLFDGYNQSSIGNHKFGWCINEADNGQPGCVAPYYIVNSGGINWGAAAGYTTNTQTCDVFNPTNGECFESFSNGIFLQEATFNSSQGMNALIGAELNGVWILKIRDNLTYDDGFIKSWSISFPGDCYSDLETETPILDGGLWTHFGTGPAVPVSQTVTDEPILPTGVDPCPGDADCTGNQLSNTITVGPFTEAGTFIYEFNVRDEFGCEFTKEVEIIVDGVTTEFEEIQTEYCLNEEPDELLTTSLNGVEGTWYPDVINTSEVGGPTLYTFTPNEGICGTSYEINVTVFELLEADFEPIQQEYCQFEEANLLPDDSVEGYTGSWYPAIIDTEYVGSQIYTFTPDDICVAPFEIEITIVEKLMPSFPEIGLICQNTEAPDLPDTNNGISGTWFPAEINTSVEPGEYEYEFTPAEGECAFTATIIVTITEEQIVVIDLPNSYCQFDEAGILPTNMNGIEGIWIPAVIITDDPGIETYTFYPDAGQCALDTPFTIEIFAQPVLNTVSVQEICDDDFDGLYETNLTTLNPELGGGAGISYIYYASLTDMNSDNPIPSNQWNNYTFNSLPTTIYIVGESGEGCRSVETAVQFEARDIVAHNVGPFGPIEYCPENTVDLTQFEGNINGSSGVNFSYYSSINNAQNESGGILSTTEFSPEQNQTSVFVRLDLGGYCPAIVEILLERLPTPSLEISENSVLLCEGDSFDASASSDDPNATFEWTFEDGTVYTGALQTFNQIGTYTIVAISEDGCVSEERTLNVSLPSLPVITGVEMGSNSVTVTASNNGEGQLEYSLDGVLWQNSPQFNNLIPGETYTIWVRSRGCMIDKYVVTIISVPNFISPNNDGKNDTWEIRGIEVTQGATIKIFDRFGKIFVDRSFGGNYQWDGKYLGNNVPSGDYWYIIQIPSDGIIKDQKFVGHISVRNQ